MARPTLASLNTIIDQKVARILALEAENAELRAQLSEPSARPYTVKHYGNHFKVAIRRGDDVQAALAAFRADNPRFAQSSVAVEFV